MKGLFSLITTYACIMHCAILLAAPPATSKPNAVPTLPAGFDNDFRFTNSFNLRGKILFTANIAGFDRILALDLDGQRIIKVIDGPGNNSFPSWAPDGIRFAFVSDRDGNQEIYLADLNGKNVKRVTENTVMDDHPSWSADGTQLLFLTQESKGSATLKTNIVSYTPTDGAQKKLTNFNGKNSTPQLSPNNVTLAYTTNRFWPGWDVCVFDIKSGTESCPLSGTSTYCRPNWSHNGRYLAYSSGIAGINGYIYSIVDDTSFDVAITEGDDYDLVWSKNDKHIVFSSDAEKTDSYDLYVVEVALNPEKPSEPSPLLRSSHSLRYPSWWQPS